MVTGNEIKNQV